MAKNQKHGIPQNIGWDKVFKNNYASECFQVEKWLYVADDLLACAAMLEPKVKEVWRRLELRMKDGSTPLISSGPIKVYFMLLAYAIENLFKGVLIRKNINYRKEFESKLKFPSELSSHDLVTLAQMAGLRLSLKREELLRRFTRCAEWDGRYPVPLNYRKMFVSPKFRDGKTYNLSYLGASDLNRAKTLIKAIRRELQVASRRIRVPRLK
jgi:hypothetical protein